MCTVINFARIRTFKVSTASFQLYLNNGLLRLEVRNPCGPAGGQIWASRTACHVFPLLAVSIYGRRLKPRRTDSWNPINDTFTPLPIPPQAPKHPRSSLFSYRTPSTSLPPFQ